ncbi:DUF4286 family protein [Botryobacter ruber]|uniref:DUF4286 family protein n=1 Tax=Botryobacter ruber TaxID=2171629 RepID=UPI000E0A5BC0|nr:DUF4286 family protein [Botryobacter ruber]
MILYNITVNVENSVADEWLEWMTEVHIPEVMRTGFFLRNQICRLLTEIENGGTTYAVQYHCRNLDDLEEYQRTHAAEMQARQLKRYGESALAFESVLEIVGTDVERDNS